jgi:hypothetical protein
LSLELAATASSPGPTVHVTDDDRLDVDAGNSGFRTPDSIRRDFSESDSFRLPNAMALSREPRGHDAAFCADLERGSSAAAPG